MAANRKRITWAIVRAFEEGGEEKNRRERSGGQ
jgi:hypothetical protein